MDTKIWATSNGLTRWMVRIWKLQDWKIVDKNNYKTLIWADMPMWKKYKDSFVLCKCSRKVASEEKELQSQDDSYTTEFFFSH